MFYRLYIKRVASKCVFRKHMRKPTLVLYGESLTSKLKSEVLQSTQRN